RRAAAAAGPEAGLFGRFRNREEGHQLTPRAATGAGRPAVDARRAYRVDERAVEAAVARQHDVPEVGGRGMRDGGRVRAGHVVEPSTAPIMRLSAFGRQTQAPSPLPRPPSLACLTSRARPPKARRSRGPSRLPFGGTPRVDPGDGP